MVAQRGKLARKCTLAFFVEATWRMSTTTVAPFQDGLMTAKCESQSCRFVEGYQRTSGRYTKRFLSSSHLGIAEHRCRTVRVDTEAGRENNGARPAGVPPPAPASDVAWFVARSTAARFDLKRRRYLSMRSQSFRPVPSTKNSRDIKNLAGMVWIALLMACAMGVAQAQTYSIVASFNGTDGDVPATSLVQGVDGNFYGTTAMGGGSKTGNAYRVTPTGELTSIYVFCSLPYCVDGNEPQSAMVLGPDGNFYGTTSAGGANIGSCFGLGCGTVFRLTPAGKLTTLYSFCPVPNCLDGSVPLAALVLGGDGNFYGTTYNGGEYGRGTVFKISPSGKFQRLYSFCKLANCADGSYPVTALIQGKNGNFYGTTYDGGSVNCSFFGGTYGCGTIFEITAAGTLTSLYSFGTNAGLLQAPVVQGSNGNLYGTSTNGGTGLCNYGCGTVFELTPAGSYSALYNFCTKGVCPDGAYPMAGLLRATDGSLYGTTTTGGTGVGEGGTLFAVKPSGA